MPWCRIGWREPELRLRRPAAARRRAGRCCGCGQARRARRPPDRHGVRPRRRRVHADRRRRGCSTAKGRGRDMPVPVLVPSPRTVDGLAFGLSRTARDLIEAFWPGPLTVVVREQPTLAWDLGDAAGTVALRMPAAPGRARAAARGRADGGQQREPLGIARRHHDPAGAGPARRHRSRSTSTAARAPTRCPARSSTVGPAAAAAAPRRPRPRPAALGGSGPRRAR